MAKRETTWAGFRDAPTGNFCQTLVEIKCREILTGTWTTGGGGAPNTYYMAVTQRIDQHNRRTAAAAQADNTTLTSQASLANCNSNAGSFWWDDTNSRLYVRLNPTADPTNLHLVSFDFWLYYSFGPEAPGSPVTFQSQDYRPLVMAVPTISRETAEMYSGVPITGSGVIVLANPQVNGADGETAPGIFDDLLDIYEWLGSPVRVLFGGDDLPYSAFQLLWTGRVQQVDWTEDSVSVTVYDGGGDLERPPLQTVITRALFTDALPGAIGKVQPIVYGACQNVTAWCIDTTTLNFVIAEHGIAALEKVEIDQVGEVIPYSVDLSSGRFRLPEHLRAYVIDQGLRVFCQLVGRTSGGYALTNVVDVMGDFLTNYVGVTPDAASFAVARLLSSCFHVALAIPAPRPSRDIVDGLCRTMIAFLTPDAAGAHILDMPEPMRSDATADRLLDDVTGAVGAISPSWDATRTKGGYTVSTAPESAIRDTSAIQNGALLYLLADANGQQTVRRTDYVSLATALESTDMTVVLANRAILFYGAAIFRCDVAITRQWFDLAIDSYVKLTARRAPDSGGVGWYRRGLRLLAIRMDPANSAGSVHLEDLANQIANYGTWKAGGTPNWGASSGAQKLAGGYWTDANGLADGADATSFGYSLWS